MKFADILPERSILVRITVGLYNLSYAAFPFIVKTKGADVGATQYRTPERLEEDKYEGRTESKNQAP